MAGDLDESFNRTQYVRPAEQSGADPVVLAVAALAGRGLGRGSRLGMVAAVRAVRVGLVDRPERYLRHQSLRPVWIASGLVARTRRCIHAAGIRRQFLLPH